MLFYMQMSYVPHLSLDSSQNACVVCKKNVNNMQNFKQKKKINISDIYRDWDQASVKTNTSSAPTPSNTNIIKLDNKSKYPTPYIK